MKSDGRRPLNRFRSSAKIRNLKFSEPLLLNAEEGSFLT